MSQRRDTDLSCSDGDAPHDPLGLCGQVLAETYEVLSPIGAGGFGAVYRARHLMLNRIVALKVQRSSAELREHLVERVRREAQACWQLHDAGAVEVYDCRRDPATGRMFIAMEMLVGRSLWSRWNAARTLPPEEAVLHVRRAARCLAVAHARGFVHRDIKPENIFLCDDGSLRVLDFGSVLMIDAARLTRPGEFLGTTCYMPDEQLLRPTGQLDGRVDVYALGVVLYHLLTGRLLYARPQELMVVEGHVHRAPPVDILDVAPLVPRELARVVRKAVARDAEARYASMNSFIDDLDRLQAQSSASRGVPTLKEPVAPELLAVCAATSDGELPKTIEYNVPTPILADERFVAAAGSSKSAARTVNLRVNSSASAVADDRQATQRPPVAISASGVPGTSAHRRFFIGAAVAVMTLLVASWGVARINSSGRSPAAPSSPTKPSAASQPMVANTLPQLRQQTHIVEPTKTLASSSMPVAVTRVHLPKHVSGHGSKTSADAPVEPNETQRSTETPKLAPNDVVDPTF